MKQNARKGFRLLVALTVVGLFSHGRTQAGPITFNTALPVPQGQWILRGQYLLIRASGDPTPMGREVTVNAAPFVLAHGVTPRLAGFAIVAYLDKSLEVDTPLGRRKRGDSGIGDSLLIGRYTALAVDRPGSTLRLAPFAGVKLPTGRDDASDSLGRLPQPLQLGSGSWDGLGGVTFSWQTLGWEIDADAGYRANGEANEFRFGDEAFTNLSFQYRLWPRKLQAGVPGFLYGVIESNLARQERHEVAGIADPNSGGTRWDLVAGLQYVTARFVLEAAVKVPAVERLHGTALETDYQATAGFRWNF